MKTSRLLKVNVSLSKLGGDHVDPSDSLLHLDVAAAAAW